MCALHCAEHKIHNEKEESLIDPKSNLSLGVLKNRVDGICRLRLDSGWLKLIVQLHWSETLHKDRMYSVLRCFNFVVFKLIQYLIQRNTYTLLFTPLILLCFTAVALKLLVSLSNEAMYLSTTTLLLYSAQ